MSFGQPVALLALFALVPIAAAWAYAAWRRRGADRAVAGPDALRRGRSRSRDLTRAALLFGAVACIALAVAQPRWGGAESPLTRRGIDVVVALDISRSMLATDVAPSRASAAAAGLNDMLDHLRGDRVGLVTFGGSAFARSPLTLDLDAIAFLVNRAQLEGALVKPGTDIGAALQASLKTLDVPDHAQTQAIVVISDGENLGTDLDAAIEAARSRGVQVYTVAVGTDNGATVPPRSTPTITQPAAEDSTVSRADRATLGRIASETGGETREVAGIAGLAVEFARLQQTDFEATSETIPIERFQWFLGAAVALLLAQWAIAEGARVRLPLRIGSRRSLHGAGLLGLFLTLLLAGCGGTAAHQKVEEGNAAYAAGRYDDALVAYDAAQDLLPGDPIVGYDIGNTLERLGRFEDAIKASRTAAQGADRNDDSRTYVSALYAVGNHALQAQQLEAARDAYIDALLRDPSDADAKHNLELVLRVLQPDQTPPGATPTPTPAAGQATPGGSPAPGDGSAQPGTPGAGQPAGSPTRGTGTPGAQPGVTATPLAGGTPGATGIPQTGTGQATQPGAGEGESLEAQLNELLADGGSVEDALAILDRLRQQSEVAGLEPNRSSGVGDAGDR